MNDNVHIPAGSDDPASLTKSVQEDPIEFANSENLRTVFEYAPVGICVTGLDKQFLRVNRRLCTMLGYTAEQLIGSSWTKLIHPEDMGRSIQTVEQWIKEPDDCQTLEKRFIHRSGAVIWVHSRISTVRDSSGNPSYFVVHMEDITERKRANEQLREKEERFRMIADSCPSMMWATDINGDIQFFNKACRQFYGIESASMVRDAWKLHFHPDDRQMFLEVFDLAIKECKPFSIEARARRADGAWRLLGWRAEPRVSPGGAFQGHISLGADITERTQTELARQFELSLIQSIHAETLEGILVIDQAGLVASYNKRFLEIWELDERTSDGPFPHSFIGSEGRSLMSSVLAQIEDPETFVERAMELYRDPEAVIHDEIRLMDGRVLERHSTGLKNQKGAYLGRVWYFRDITAFRQVELSLQQANALADEANKSLLAEREIVDKERNMLRTMIDNIPDILYVKDAKSRFVVANTSVARMVGAETAEELLGKTDFDFFSREQATSFFEDEQNVIVSGEALYNREEKGTDAAGNEIDILTTKVPVWDSNGKVIGIAGVGHDITARKRMEAALREAEQKYRGIFDKAIVGIFQSTPDGCLLGVNQSMAFTLGYNSPEEMLTGVTNITRDFFVSPKRSLEFMHVMDKVGGVKNFECEVFCKEGRKIWLTMSIRAIRQNGDAVRYEGMCEDITERNQLREQLLQAQKLESVGQLAAGIAHEINTPTQYIGDNVRFLQDGFQDLKGLVTNYERLLTAAKDNTLSNKTIEEIAKVVHAIDTGYLLEEIPKAIEQTLEGVTRVATIVSAMKEFSHPSTKEKILLDLNRAILSTITVARNEWKYVAEMETEFDSSLPSIPCLPGEFNQVILNLLVNAAHAIGDVVKKGGPQKGKIKVQTIHGTAWAEIRIEDTGSGIPESVQSRIFDPFFTTKEIGKGTGQGLAIARSVLVDKHGGSIRFETEEGKGTTFIIRLPSDGQTLGANGGGV